LTLERNPNCETPPTAFPRLGRDTLVEFRLADQRAKPYAYHAMHTLKAVVRNGRIIVDEPTTLPEGSELKLQLVDEDDGLDDEERAALHRSLEIGHAQAQRGEGRPAADVIRDLRARR
jgi:hypothetical protein